MIKSISMEQTNTKNGFTIVEVIVTLIVSTIVIFGVVQLFVSLLNASSLAYRRGVALELAQQEMEKLRAKPYDGLAIEGGAIATSETPIPAETTFSRENREYIAVRDIRYVDDAYDGCLNYAPEDEDLCRNGPADSSQPIDSNPKDYKLADIRIFGENKDRQLAILSSVFSARTTETDGNTGALIARVTTSAGDPVPNATVDVVNSSLSPNVNQSINTDSSGRAVFFDLPPDEDPNYTVSASKTGYTSVTTIPYPSDGRTPTYPNIAIFAQQTQSIGLDIDPLTSGSLRLNTLDMNSLNSIGNVKISLRGGYKLYIDEDDDEYSYEAVVETDSNGTVLVDNLAASNEYFACYLTGNRCHDSQSYYLASSDAQAGSDGQPMSIPVDTSGPRYDGALESVDLLLSTTPGPTITRIQPNSTSVNNGNLHKFRFNIRGEDLPLNATVTLEDGSDILSTENKWTDRPDRLRREVNLPAEARTWDVIIDGDGFNIRVENAITVDG